MTSRSPPLLPLHNSSSAPAPGVSKPFDRRTSNADSRYPGRFTGSGEPASPVDTPDPNLIQGREADNGMQGTGVIYFSSSEKKSIQKTFMGAETLAGNYFQLSPEEWQHHRYEVKTLEYLEQHETSTEAFAQLCKYVYKKRKEETRLKEFHFFRICLQDNRILDAVRRGGSFIRFAPLMLYIATHELVHILRFNRAESDFDMCTTEKEKEEETVHLITLEILKPVADSHLTLVLDCFGDDYRLGDLFR